MGPEDHKAIFRRLVEEAWNKGNTAVLNEVTAPQYVYRTPSGEFKGPEGEAQAIKINRAAFSDLHLTIDEMVAEGDRLVARNTATGTFTGELMGIPPTGKRFTMTAAVFVRYVDGKLVEAVSIFDQLSMFQQLGIKPPME